MRKRGASADPEGVGASVEDVRPPGLFVGPGSEGPRDGRSGRRGDHCIDPADGRFMATPALDRDALIELLDGDPGLIVTLIDSFLTDCPDYMEAIREAVANEDAATLEREAHGLKGAAGSLRAHPASEAAQALEEMGHAENFAEAEAALETLEAEIDRLTDELRALKDECQEAVGE